VRCDRPVPLGARQQSSSTNTSPGQLPSERRRVRTDLARPRIPAEMRGTRPTIRGYEVVARAYLK
jgi:hypothetical protein